MSDDYEDFKRARLTRVRDVAVEPATDHADEIGLFNIRFNSSSNMTTVLDMNMLELVNLRDMLTDFISANLYPVVLDNKEEQK